MDLTWQTCPHDLDLYVMVPWSTKAVGFGLPSSRHPILDIEVKVTKEAETTAAGRETITIFGADVLTVDASCFRFAAYVNIYSNCAGYGRSAASITVSDTKPLSRVTVLSPEAGSYDWPDPCPALSNSTSCTSTCDSNCRYARIWHALSFELESGLVSKLQETNVVQTEISPFPDTSC